MSRPGFALKVDEHTPQLLTLAGDRVRLQRFPIGTEVIYPPQPVASSDPVALVEGALANPVDSAPLKKLLRPSMKLTLMVGNVDPVQPRMRFDIRRTILERVLEHAARARSPSWWQAVWVLVGAVRTSSRSSAIGSPRPFFPREESSVTT